MNRAPWKLIIFRAVMWTLIAVWCGIMMVGGTALLAKLIRGFINKLP